MAKKQAVFRFFIITRYTIRGFLRVLFPYNFPGGEDKAIDVWKKKNFR